LQKLDIFGALVLHFPHLIFGLALINATPFIELITVITIFSVVNNSSKKYSQYQYIYFMKKVLTIPIPINELQKYAILSPILSAILFFR